MNYQIVKDYQAIQITGPDSEKFLQGQLTCDISQANGSSVIIGGYCNVQGRLHATFYALKSGDNYFLICPKAVTQHLLETLLKYAVFFNTELTLAKELSLIVQETNGSANHLAQIASAEKISFQFYVGKLLVSLGDEDALNNMVQVQPSDFTETDQELLALEQIELGIPMIEAETIESFLPHYIGLSQIGGVNYEKGCYTGQEVVARMHYRGTLKTHPHTAEILTNEQVTVGSSIHNEQGKKVGELINSVILGQSHQALISLADKALNDNLSIGVHQLKIKTAEP